MTRGWLDARPAIFERALEGVRGRTAPAPGLPARLLKKGARRG